MSSLVLGPARAAHGTVHRPSPITRQDRRTGLLLGMVFAAAIAGCANEPMSAREKGTATGAVAGNLWSKHMADKQRALEQATVGTGIDVARTDDNRLKLNIPSDFSFDTGRADIRPGMKPVLDEVARSLQAGVHIDVVGHTDNTGSVAVNQPLSVERADAVRDC